MKKTILVIGDTHEPFCLDGYLEHCVDMADTINADTIVHIGDLVDLHAMSFHDHDPNGYSIGEEIEKASKKVKLWVEAFPKAYHIMGNHDMLIERKLMRHGIPKAIMRDFADVLKMPHRKQWTSHSELIIDGVLYRHGVGAAGMYGHRNAAIKSRMSIVQGHSHGVAGIEYLASKRDIIFGMAVGCGVDINAYAAAYGKHIVQKPVISCATIIDGKYPQLHTMDLGSDYGCMDTITIKENHYAADDEIIDAAINEIELQEYLAELSPKERKWFRENL